jgi:hypothetical protein
MFMVRNAIFNNISVMGLLLLFKTVEGGAVVVVIVW